MGRLLLGWVTASDKKTVWVCNQPSRSTQPSTHCGMVKWALAFSNGGRGLLAANRRVYGSSPSAWSKSQQLSRAVYRVNQVNSRNNRVMMTAL